MTEIGTLRLHELRGHLKARRAIAKADAKAARDELKTAASPWVQGYLQGIMRARTKELKHLLYTMRILSNTLKEIKDNE